MLKSKYANYDAPNPYVNPEERTFIDWEVLTEYEDNIFIGSAIPVVGKKKKVKTTLSTTVLREPDGNQCKASVYGYTYELNSFDRCILAREIAKLNRMIIKHSSFRYRFSTFKREWRKNALFVYNYEKNVFDFSTYTLRPKHDSVMIEYDEDGSIKKALVCNTLKHGVAKSTFKHYKDGFDLYMVTYGGGIRYRRNKK